MPKLPEQLASWADVPRIETTDRVLGGPEGPANAQALALLKRTQFLREAVETIEDALAVVTGQSASASAAASSAEAAASGAVSLATSAQAAATGSSTVAANAQSAASAAAAVATAAQTAATDAGTVASAAQAAANAKAVRIDLGTVSITYTAVLALGAGARSVVVACPGALPGDAVFVAPTGAVPDGYAIGAAQCLTTAELRVSVVHPALVLGASFTIAARAFALR